MRRQAASWYVATGRPIEAVEHLLEIGEHRAAHRLVLEHFDLLYVGTRRRDLGRWLVAVPDEVIMSSLDLAVEHCRALALLAHEDAPRWYRHCDERLPADDHRHRPRLMAVNALHHAINARLDEMRAWRDEARSQRAPGTEDPVDEVLTSWEVRLEALLGDAARAVEIGRALAASDRVLLHDAPAMSVLSGALAAAGRTEEAEAVAGRALQRWREAGEPELPGVIDALVVSARAARRHGRLDEAEELVAMALAISPRKERAHLLSSLPLLEQGLVDQAFGRSEWRDRLVVLAEELRMIGSVDRMVDRVVSAMVGSATAGTTNPERSVQGDDPHQPLVDPLTEREHSILGYLSSHLTFPEIGEELFISRHTVKTHSGRIYRKLGVTSRSAAVAEARRRGLIAGSPIIPSG